MLIAHPTAAACRHPDLLQSLMPEWAKAALALKEYSSDVILAKVCLCGACPLEGRLHRTDDTCRQALVASGIPSCTALPALHHKPWPSPFRC